MQRSNPQRRRRGTAMLPKVNLARRRPRRLTGRTGRRLTYRGSIAARKKSGRGREGRGVNIVVDQPTGKGPQGPKAQARTTAPPRRRRLNARAVAGLAAFVLIAAVIVAIVVARSDRGARLRREAEARSKEGKPDLAIRYLDEY